MEGDPRKGAAIEAGRRAARAGRLIAEAIKDLEAVRGIQLALLDTVRETDPSKPAFVALVTTQVEVLAELRELASTLDQASLTYVQEILARSIHPDNQKD